MYCPTTSLTLPPLFFFSCISLWIYTYIHIYTYLHTYIYTYIYTYTFIDMLPYYFYFLICIYFLSLIISNHSVWVSLTGWTAVCYSMAWVHLNLFNNSLLKGIKTVLPFDLWDTIIFYMFGFCIYKAVLRKLFLGVKLLGVILYVHFKRAQWLSMSLPGMNAVSHPFHLLQHWILLLFLIFINVMAGNDTLFFSFVCFDFDQVYYHNKIRVLAFEFLLSISWLYLYKCFQLISFFPWTIEIPYIFCMVLIFTHF